MNAPPSSSADSHDQPADLAPQGDPPGIGARLALWGVLALVLAHTAAVALWIAPPNLMRQIVGNDRLTSYIRPTWDQAWSVFAPDADYRTDRLEVRALLRTDQGGTSWSPWVQLTSREVVDTVRHHPFPSRTALITTRLSGRVLAAFNKLGAAQKNAYAAADTKVDLQDLNRSLQAAAVSPKEKSAASYFMQLEGAIEYFLSGLGDAIWGETLLGVQYRRNYVDVANYSRPHTERQVLGGYNLVSNVRPVVRLTDADRAAYASYASEFRFGER